MKIKANKILAVLCVIAMVMTMIVPMTLTAAATDTTITFNLGNNGSESHYDNNSSQTTYSETVNGYTLSITGGTNMYPGSRDAKGNGVIKLGASSKAGSASFTVPNDVISVVIYAAKYKANTTKLTVNGTTHTLTKNSNDGAYDAITVDTSTTKTVSFTTVSGGYRCMIDKIVWVIPASGGGEAGGCGHTNTILLPAEDATCTKTGRTEGTKCNDCDAIINGWTEIPALDHDWDEGVVNPAPTCTAAGTMTYTCKRDGCDEKKTETVPALGHSFDGDTCTVCGAEKPSEATITFDDTSKRTIGTTSQQVWVESGITVTNNKDKSSTSINTNYYNPIRLYQSSTLIVECSLGNITQIVFDCNSSDYATTLKTSMPSGTSASVSNDKVTVTLDGTSNSFTVTMSAQVRMDAVTVAYATANSDCEHDYITTIKSATCTELGSETITCSKCDYEQTTTSAALGHAWDDGITTPAPTCTEAGTTTYTCTRDNCDETMTKYVPSLGHNIVESVCIRCHKEIGEETKTITFDDTSKRIDYSTTAQVWAENGITVTNNKDKSTTNIGDYSNPARFYKSSTIIITAPAGITKIVINAPDGEYGDPWETSIKDAGYTVDGADGIYTITLDGTLNSISLVATAQIRVNSIEVTYGESSDTDGDAISKISVNVGSDLSLLAHVAITDDTATYKVVFKHALGRTIEVDVVNGIAKLDNIAPQAITDAFTIQLMKDGEVVDTIENYSIKTYVQAILNGTYPDEVKTFVSDLLVYCAAAQKHQNPEIADESLATYGVDLKWCSTVNPDATVNVNKGTKHYDEAVAGLTFTAVGVKFDAANYIYAKFTAANLEGITVTINGNAAEIVEHEDGGYVVYTDAILATGFGDTYTIVLYNGEDAYQTLAYSVNSYAFAKADTELGLALYRYGVSAAALNN